MCDSVQDKTARNICSAISLRDWLVSSLLWLHSLILNLYTEKTYKYWCVLNKVILLT